MCGIVSIISKEPRGLFLYDKELFEEALTADIIRGKDSTGVFSVSMKNELHVVKQGIDALTFMRSPSYKEWADKIPSYRAIVGHNRKATSGDINSKNAHPFKEGDITLVHNGMLFNAKELNKEVDVDSHALCHSFATKGAKETLKDVSGAFALIWYDLKKKEMYLWRNSERPLALVETDDKIVIASELNMIKWILQREKRVCTIKREGTLKENVLYTIKLNPFEMTEESLAREYKPVFQSHSPLNTVQDWPVGPPRRRNNIIDIESGEWLEQAEEAARHLRDINSGSSLNIRKTYPFDSEVLFEVGNVEIYTDKPPKYEVHGKIFLPGSPVVKGYIYTANGTPLSTIKQWKDSKKIVGEVKAILGIPDGRAVIHLKADAIKLPACVKTRFGSFYPLIEWNYICANHKCHMCDKKVNPNESEKVSVNSLHLGEYRVVCETCIDNQLGKNKKQLPSILHMPPIEQNPEPKIALSGIHSVPLSADMQAVVEATQREYKKDTHGS